MPFQIVRNNIARVAADAIVNTANPEPVIGGGTDSAIYEAAGERKLLAERLKIGRIEPGGAEITKAFQLNARYIIHTVGPLWIDGEHGETDILRSCYARSLDLANKYKCKSIAFPMIATGTYGFPKDAALEIALSEIGKFLLTHEMDITLVVFSRESFELSSKRMGEIQAYIDDHTVSRLEEAEYHAPDRNLRCMSLDQRRRGILRDTIKPSLRPSIDAQPAPMKGNRYHRFESRKLEMCTPPETDKEAGSLESFLDRTEDTFQQRLMKLIIKSGMDDVTVYKRANVDRKVFSYIRNHIQYHPNKETAISFGIALRLNMTAMQDLLRRAGYAFSPADLSDLIISYYIEHGIYDIYQINAALFKYEQKTL